jgi:type II secretory pathway component PulF
MSNLFRAGLSPKTVVEVAAQTMPNLELSRQMSSAAQSMRAETKLSEVASRVSMLTPEMQTIVSTGEFVGDLPGALQNVATAHQGEFQSTSKMSTARIGCWMLLLLTLGTYLMFMIFVRKFYDTAFQKLGEEPLPMLVRPLSQDQTLP